VPRILIVATAGLSAGLERTVLFRPGTERVVASSAPAAFESARSFNPTLVVLDDAALVNDLGMVRRLRDSPGTRRSSLVVINHAGGPGEDALRECGANAVLRAPADPATWDRLFEGLMIVPRRIKTKIPVVLAVGGAPPETATSLDLSLNGMLLDTESPLRVGMTLELRFCLPGSTVELKATAQVVRSNPVADGTNYGVRFLSLHGAAHERIREYAQAIPAGRTIGRYEIRSLLAEGAMGQVHRAWDPLAQRDVAIKTIRSEQLMGGAPEALKRFRREAQSVARLVHPNIVTIFDVGEDYFVMELCEGVTLQRLLYSRSPLERDEVLRLLEPIAEALDYAHAQGVVHRDVKPANIMILPDGRTKLMDFGIATFASGTITAKGDVLGSPAYMAPEQVTGGQVGPATDCFSLAAVAYEALSGRRPFEGDTITQLLFALVHGDPAPPSRWNPRLPSEYDEILGLALSKDAQRRTFHRASELVAALRTETVPSSELPPMPAPAPRADPVAETVDLSRSGLVLGLLASGPVATAPPSSSSGARLLLAVAALVVAGLFFGFAGTQGLRVQPEPPGIRVSTVPAGAHVAIDGVALGAAPLFLAPPPPGAHRLKLTLSGFAPVEVDFEAPVAGDRLRLDFTLQPQPGVAADVSR
jgi:serine/threonine-protein kinase